MATITLKDILIGARQESYRMRHFYVGAEHLFIALLDNKGGLAGNIIQEYGLTPVYVIDAVRRKIGKELPSLMTGPRISKNWITISSVEANWPQMATEP